MFPDPSYLTNYTVLPYLGCLVALLTCTEELVHLLDPSGTATDRCFCCSYGSCGSVCGSHTLPHSWFDSWPESCLAAAFIYHLDQRFCLQLPGGIFVVRVFMIKKFCRCWGIVVTFWIIILCAISGHTCGLQGYLPSVLRL